MRRGRADAQARDDRWKPDRAAAAATEEIGNDTVAERDAPGFARRERNADQRQRQLALASPVSGSGGLFCGIPIAMRRKAAHFGLDPGFGAVLISSCVRPAGSIAGPMLTTT